MVKKTDDELCFAEARKVGSSTKQLVKLSMKQRRTCREMSRAKQWSLERDERPSRELVVGVSSSRTMWLMKTDDVRKMQSGAL